MKKILLSLIATVLAGFAYAQQESTAPTTSHVSPHTAPHIRTDRKELKREHHANRELHLEMQIRKDKRELRHMRNGKQHEMNRNHHARPVKRGNGGMHRHPMMDHKRK